MMVSGGWVCSKCGQVKFKMGEGGVRCALENHVCSVEGN